ncbi:MAG: hypothetical protein J6P48_04590 [Oscillospiraceae bacterium]|nr:hypothetical protein [Oscillospiraceae bacterium]
MEENEIREEMDVVATEFFAVTEDLINSNEAMKAEILANVQDLVKEVQEASFDTQQSIDGLKEVLTASPDCCQAKAETASPAGDVCCEELKTLLEQQKKLTTLSAVAAVIAAIAAVIGLFF